MTGERAERFVVLNLRLMAIGFAITGFFFIAWPDGTLARITELGHHFGFHTPAPKTEERLELRRTTRDETEWVRRAVLAEAA